MSAAAWTGGGAGLLSGEVAAAAGRCADSAVYVDTAAGTVWTTIGEIHDQARRVCAGLQDLGVGPGDVVAVQLPNCPESLVVYQGVLLSGAALAPVVHVYGPREVEFILRESAAKVLVMPDRWKAIDYADRVGRFLDIDTLEQVVVIGEPVEGTLDWASLAKTGEPREVRVSAGDVCLLAYTSGTTADPKGVQHTQAGLLAEVLSQRTMLGVGDDQVQLVSFPGGHIAGVVSFLRPLLLGTPTVLMDGWDPARALELIADHGVTFSAGTPLHLATLLDALEEGAPIGSLREYLVGAATVPPDLLARADALGITAFRSYGSTEHPTISSGTIQDPLKKRQFTDGRPTEGTEIRVVDERGDDVALGCEGEVVCRGPEQFVGYRDSALDAGFWLDDGWMRTGDIGRLDEDGYLAITDRAKDVIIRAGETISSREVEDVLLDCPGVLEAAAIAIPDPYYGEKVGAVVVLRPDESLDLAAVQRHFADAGLARQKTAEHLELRDALPRTPIGKVRKSDLRKEVGSSLADIPSGRPG